MVEFFHQMYKGVAVMPNNTSKTKTMSYLKFVCIVLRLWSYYMYNTWLLRHIVRALLWWL